MFGNVGLKIHPVATALECATRLGKHQDGGWQEYDPLRWPVTMHHLRGNCLGGFWQEGKATLKRSGSKRSGNPHELLPLHSDTQARYSICYYPTQVRDWEAEIPMVQPWFMTCVWRLFLSALLLAAPSILPGSLPHTPPLFIPSSLLLFPSFLPFIHTDKS